MEVCISRFMRTIGCGDTTSIHCERKFSDFALKDKTYEYTVLYVL